jgi:hypothetical protein
MGVHVPANRHKKENGGDIHHHLCRAHAAINLMAGRSIGPPAW